jgi:oligoendopeptidase F
MQPLPFGALPAHVPRRFVPERIDLGDWAQIAPLFDQLETRLAGGAVSDLEQWLLDWGELSAALDEESSCRHIAMTCHTDDAEIERAYLHFVEKIEPHLKPRQFRLAQLYLAHPQRDQLPAARYQVLNRDMRAQVELFRERNVPLQTQESKLTQRYQKLMGALTVQFRGEEQTLVQMGRYLEEPDRVLREEAWSLVTERRLQERDAIDAIYDELVHLRDEMARHADCASYVDYAFRMYRRFDYAPADCERFHEAVEEEFLPLVRELHQQRRASLRIESLRPWDLAVDPLGRSPLRPFAAVEQLEQGTQRIFDGVDPSLGQQFRALRDRKLLDLDNRKGKAPGGYQSNLSEARWPFIFMNAVGQQRDVETLLHEGGHAFHALATQEEELFAYRSEVPIEMCEVASMSMELLGNEYIEAFYAPEEARRARRTHLESIVKFFPWCATVDAFQHWVYTHPQHTRQERAAAWQRVMNRFDLTDWSGYETARAHLWHRQPHFFTSPFYYIEYGIAQLGALQVWVNSKRDRAAALDSYKRALALGGSRPLPDLFRAAGCRWDFGRDTMRGIVDLLRTELARLA